VRSSLTVLVVVVLGMLGLLVVFDVPLSDPLWWLSNETPPHVAIGGPATGALRGTVEAPVALEPAARARVVSVRVDDQPRTLTDGKLVLDTTALPDGPHRAEVVAHDTSRRQNLANAVWTFTTDNTPPKLDVTLDPDEGPAEGRTSVVHMRADEPVRDLRAHSASGELRLQPDGTGGYWALVGIAPGPASTLLGLDAAAADTAGNPTEAHREWQIRPTTFAEDDLDLEPTLAERDARSAEDAQLEAIYQRPNGPRQWEGAFRVPVVGDVTTAFGTHRSYEYHPGMDFGATLGAPVLAPATGIVAFVGSVPARGNVLVLDHGAGVYSTYAHLQQVAASEGSVVKPGQVIARVGSTGFSTGPHLHWEMWVNGANVDPREWTRRAFP
jgi:murein DD-endopeptidase MepM/ murein hydrolase activator NlpD